MNSLINVLASFRAFKRARQPSGLCLDGDHLLLFGYQKWFNYEAQGLIPFFTHGPLIFWMYPVFGMKGSTYLLGVSEWLFGVLLLAGFWNKKLGILGALGSIVTFLCTVTIIPFMPDGWAASAGGFGAIVGNVAFLMKDVVLLAVSFYLLKHDLVSITPTGDIAEALYSKPKRSYSHV